MIPLPSKPKIIEKKENFAKFEIDGLYPGYGTTVGNSLRRVLLSSLEGAAVTRVKIKGVQHEFSTLEGVSEDILNIILNLKQLRFKSFSAEPQVATLKVKGEEEISGGDFRLTSELELINPDTHIATLTQKSSELEMEITIEKGIGYEPVERRKKGKLEIGEIMMDAIFNPVKKVSLAVENSRVGDRTDFDKIVLGLETDGSITPEEAFNQANDIIIKTFESFKTEEKK
jgi:DNA-directed RNA polymerase subunit alpha